MDDVLARQQRSGRLRADHQSSRGRYVLAPLRLVQIARNFPAWRSRQTRNPIWTLLASGIGVFMGSMDILVVTNALPVIRQSLNTDLEGLEWTVNSFTLTFAVFLVTGAALGDRFGRRRMLAIGMATFTVASAAAALAPSIGALVMARAVQGVGGAIVVPLTLTLLASAFPPERRGLAFGVWSAMSGLGVALGPAIGGVIMNYASWQWIFWINVPVGAMLLPIILGFVPESRGGAGRLDPVGVSLVTAGLFGVVLGLVRAGGHGWTSAQVFPGLVTGALALLAFVVWQMSAPTPMVPPELFRNRGFSVANVVSLAMGFGMFGAVFFGAQFLQTVEGYTPLGAGLRLLPCSAAPAIAAPLSGVLSDRFGTRQVVSVALALQAVGVGWLGLESRPDLPYSRIVPPFVLAGIGIGLFLAPMARLTLSFAPRNLEGMASGTTNALRHLGTVLGIAVLGSVFSAYGSYANANEFVAGMTAAMMVGAVVLAVGSGLILFASGRTPVVATTAARRTA
jgi:EmrB/QacA subfamily drug resistance transporter